MKKLFQPHSLNIPGVVAFDKSLPEGAMRLYGVIEAFSWKSGVCWATTIQLSEVLEKSESTIERWLKALEDRDHLHRITFCQPYLDEDKKTRYYKKREIRLGKKRNSKNVSETVKNDGIVEPVKNDGLNLSNSNLSNSSKQQQQSPPDSLPSLRSVRESQSPQNKDAPTKNFTETKKLPKSVVAAANNKYHTNTYKDDHSLTNNSLTTLLEKSYGSLLQSGEGPPPPVVPATPVRTSCDAAFEKRYVVPSAVGMTIKKKEDAAVAAEDQDKEYLLEQLKDCFTGEDLKTAEELVEHCSDWIFSQNDPIGAAVAAIRRDYAKGRIADAKQWKRHGLKAAKQQQLGSDKDAIADANRHYAKAMYDRLKPKYIHRIFDLEMGANHITVTYWRKGRMMSHNIGFLEDNFEWKVDQLEKSCMNYIGWIKKDFGHKLKNYHDMKYLEELGI